MAIEKIVLTDSGVEIKHWVITGLIAYDKVKELATIMVSGYASESARDNGLQPLVQIPYTITNTTEVVQEEIPLSLEEKRSIEGNQEKSDEELNGIDLKKVVVNIAYPKNYFTEFKDFNDSGRWQEGAYNFLKTYSSTKDIFSTGTEV